MSKETMSAPAPEPKPKEICMSTGCTYTTYCRGEKCVGSKRRKAKPEASPFCEYMKTLKGLKVSLCESKELQSVPMTLVWVQMQVHHKNLSNMSCLPEVK